MSVRADPDNPRGRRKAVGYSQKGRARLSHLYLMGFRNHVLKVRFTYDKDMQETAEAVRVKLLRALSEMTGTPSREPRRVEANAYFESASFCRRSASFDSTGRSARCGFRTSRS